MSNDARLNTGILQHPKSKKLNRKFGPQGPLSFIALILWAAANRPDGDLAGMDADDIELAIDWPLDPGIFFEALIQLRLLDEIEPGHYLIHDWQDHNPWAAGSENRSQQARFAALVKRYGRAKAEQMIQQCSGHQTAVLTPSTGNAEKHIEQQPQQTSAEPSADKRCAEIIEEQCSEEQSVMLISAHSSAVSTNEQCCQHNSAVLAADLSTAPSPSPSPSPKQSDPPSYTRHPPRLGDQSPPGVLAQAGKHASRFAEFWDAYPKKVAKPEAMRRWKTKRLDVLADDILHDLSDRLSRDPAWQRGYIPNPATYLNQDRWTDELLPIPQPTTAMESANGTRQQNSPRSKLSLVEQVRDASNTWVERQTREDRTIDISAAHGANLVSHD